MAVHVDDAREPAVDLDLVADDGDPAERGQCTESLGNLVLMTRAQNDKAGNQEFAHKQQVLFAGGGVHDLPINAYVRRQTEWGAAQIREREAQLLDCLYRMWDISPPTQRVSPANRSAAKPRGVPEVTAGE